MKEAELIKSISEGNQQAFQKLYESTSTFVFNSALSYAPNQNDAEEITQQVYIKVFKNIHNFKGDSSIKTWLYRITINTSLDYIKKKKKFSFMSSGIANIPSIDFDHPGVLLERKESAKELYKVIDTLPEKQRTAFTLRFIEGMPIAEIADIMETSYKAIESLLQRAKGKLREKLKKEYHKRRK